MNQIELDIMKSMVSILNEASQAHHNAKPIMTDEQFAIRSNDLVHLEAETGVVLLNSPNCIVDVQSIVNTLETKEDRLKECRDIKDIIEFSNQKELLAYVDVNGLDMIVTYTNGKIESIQIASMSDAVLDSVFAVGIPYCSPEIVNCSIKGKLVVIDSPVFYATEVVEGGHNTLKDNLSVAKNLGFNVVPNWSFLTLNPKSFQNSVDYIFECAEEDNIPCNGIVFKMNDIECGKMLRVMSAYDGIIIKRKGDSSQ